MSATTTDRPDVEAYLAAVRAELGDLRPEERDDLVAEVEASLLDAAEESDAPIATRLGSPADFAAELRAAAGLDMPAQRRPRRTRLRELWRSPRAKTARGIFTELAPIWWVVRAYVVVALLAWLVDASWSVSVPLVPRIATSGVGVALLVLAAAASVALGLWQRRRGPAGPVVLVLNLILAIAAVPAAADLLDRVKNRPSTAIVTIVDPAPPTPGLALDGVAVENVYPYSRDGRLLLDVLLYDQFGNPLNVRPVAFDPDRRVLRARSGAELHNSFPIRYFEPGTRRVDRPGAAPAIPWSPIATPPLRRPTRP